MNQPYGPRERLIVALDVPNLDEAMTLVNRLGDAVLFYKVGLELFVSGDYMELIKQLRSMGKHVFADLKFHDVPETVSRAMRQLKDLHVDFVTLHAQDSKAIEAAVREKNGIKVLAVTVLTSLDEHDLRDDGFTGSVADLVLNRTRRAMALGCDGVVASGHEVSPIRGAHGESLLVVVPGIRGPKDAYDDQKRTVDVEQAFASGADFIVVGRPIRNAREPRAVAEEIQRRIVAVLEQR